MSVGKPAVMSAVGMNNDIIEHGVNGFTPKGEDEWFAVLCNLIEDPQLRKEIGQKARETVVERYSFDSQKYNVLKIYREVIGLPVIESFGTQKELISKE